MSLLNKDSSQLVMLTGFQVEPSLESRTKDNADHAGLSQLPEPLKDGGRLPTEVSHLSLNNNSLIAQEAMETMPVMED
jgi:hypothetical protein